uniref:Large ribosomal subunit protein uL6 alpha-beta domain-containing protein n=1 Tax=Chrysotila carterae TaxID=13221 RepID=A0A7S4ESP9_CHRCT|mmetsp:Transcript_22748/g.49688  ORF Transcript_22748/g.49688 Transcript_22748/m.49688 type:complete len:246 (+) Transcript_22748:252-989(+)
MAFFLLRRPVLHQKSCLLQGSAIRQMSKIGRMPIPVPSSVNISIEPYAAEELTPIKIPSEYRKKQMMKRRPNWETFWAFGHPKRATIEGPLGKLTVPVHSFCDVELDPKVVKVSVQCGGRTKLGKTMWGTTRSMIANAVAGVSQGFVKEMELHGVGFRARLEKDELGAEVLIMRLGYSHECKYTVPDGITVLVPTQTTVVVYGANKKQVGNVAASIRRFHEPDPYKGKGVRYVGEVLRLKPGKRR